MTGIKEGFQFYTITLNMLNTILKYLQVYEHKNLNKIPIFFSPQFACLGFQERKSEWVSLDSMLL